MGQEIYKALLFMLLGSSLVMLWEARQDMKAMRDQVRDDTSYNEAWMAKVSAACAAKGIEVPPLKGDTQ